jgi:dipeptidyl aminopeptidase/acylaminoacyl peptidase
MTAIYFIQSTLVCGMNKAVRLVKKYFPAMPIFKILKINFVFILPRISPNPDRHFSQEIHRMRSLCVGLLLFALTSCACAERVVINQWLVLPTLPLERPALADTAITDQFYLRDDNLKLPEMEPAQGGKLQWLPGMEAQWSTAAATEILNWAPPNDACYLGLAATYVQSSRWQQAELKLNTVSSVAVYLDGEKITLTTEGGSDFSARARLTLHCGKHRLIIATMRPCKPTALVATTRDDNDPAGTQRFAWTLKAALTTDWDGSLSVSTVPRHAPTSFADVTLIDNIESPALSQDARWLAAVSSHRSKDDFKKEAWIDVFDAMTNQRVRQIKTLKGIGNLQFISNNLLMFSASGEKGSSIWQCDMETGGLYPLIKDIEGLQKFAVSGDGRTIFYTADAEIKKSETDPELWDQLEDRMSDWSGTRRLYAVSLPSGITHALTDVGDFALDDFALSREGDQILFTRLVARVGRPYYHTEFWIYDLRRSQAKMVSSQSIPFETRPHSLVWLPGGERVAYASARFAETEADTVIHNNTQTDLFILNVKNGRVDDVTKSMNFSVLESEDRPAIRWNASEKSLWFLAVSKGKVVLGKYGTRIEDIPLAQPFVADFDVTGSGAFAFTGSDPISPTALYFFDPSKKTIRAVAKPAASVLPDLDLAKFEPRNFTNADGASVEGYLFYPQDYKPEMSKSWPLIVYYYGGVSPRDERFTFTYHWWCANGYFVYVLNPSGCIGYGQEFADKHSNDWGTLASRDIIDGTQRLLQDKPFLDAKRVGAYGGSYGGFITMDLVTKTDMLAAAVSDAGISNIASYFGEGTWGFTYGDIALPRSFPWNRQDVYVNKSPVFHADKIKTPLLLIHGTADDNVPNGESSQMFTALKILGKDVAYVRFPGEDHSIATNFANYVNYREMMLEWFDAHLKGEKEAWVARWKK